jgi:predicted negative regulator of RcsB-dependent stress response
VNDLSEKEQLQEMRAWWAENGRFVMTGIVLGIVVIVGWNQWRSSIERSQIEASNLYEDVMSAVGDGDTETAEVAANNLYEKYPQTVYPDQTRLAMARLYMDKGRDQDAADALRALVVASDETEIQMVGRLRLAKVLLYQNKPDEVIELLKDRGASGFAARYKEILGDAHAAEGEFAAAQTAYQEALRLNQGLPTVDNNLIQLKLNDLPDLTELAATSAAIEAAIDEGDVAEEVGTAPDEEEETAQPEAQNEASPDTGTEQ